MKQSSSMFLVKCPHCERLNQVPAGPLEEVRQLTCLRCGRPLPADARLVEPEPKRVDPVDLALGLLGLVFPPAGLALTLLLTTHGSDERRHRAAVGFAWAGIGIVIHLVLFFAYPPVHDFYAGIGDMLKPDR